MALGNALLTAGLGAGLMYVLDPDRGRERRRLTRERLVDFANRGEGALATRARDLAGRARGVAAEARSALAGEPGAAGRLGRMREQLAGDQGARSRGLLAGLAGAALLLSGARRRSLLGGLAGTAGLGLLARAASDLLQRVRAGSEAETLIETSRPRDAAQASAPGDHRTVR
jgi:hypothetical protein